MNGLIMLEGADGTGKTTLAKYLVDKYQGHYMHLTYRFPNAMWHYHAAALHRAVKLSEDRLVVLDRQWPSECLYADAYRGGTKWPHSGRLFDRVMLKHGGVYVFCLVDDLKEYSARFEKLKETRQEMFSNTLRVAEFYNQLYWGNHEYLGTGYARDIAAYGGFNRRDDAFAYRYQIEGADLNLFTNTVMEQLLMLRSTQYKHALKPGDYNFLGHAGRADYVLIGDRINKTNRIIDYPWYANVNSSLFLSQCLSNLAFHINEPAICYTNINDPLGYSHAFAMIKRGLKPIVLGKEANKVARLDESCCIPHPQYGRRFIGNGAYTEQLYEAFQC